MAGGEDVVHSSGSVLRMDSRCGQRSDGAAFFIEEFDTVIDTVALVINLKQRLAEAQTLTWQATDERLGGSIC